MKLISNEACRGSICDSHKYGLRQKENLHASILISIDIETHQKLVEALVSNL